MTIRLFDKYGSAEANYFLPEVVSWYPNDGWQIINLINKDGAIIINAMGNNAGGDVFEAVGSGKLVLIY